MSKIKMGALVLITAFTLGACSSVQFMSVDEGVEAGTYYLTAKTAAGGDSKGNKQYRYSVLKCTATTDLEWTCSEVAVNTSKK
jgi:hypothetical protein